MIRFACPSCEKVYTVPATAGGKAATCKQCGIRFQIPDASPQQDYEVVEDEPTPEFPGSPPPLTPVSTTPPPPPPAPAPAREAIQHAETMVLPALPDSPQSSGLPDLLNAPPPPPPPPKSLSFAPSPTPPPPATPATVELQPCPTCGARLTVNAEDVGAHVECPMCKSVFEGKVGPPPNTPATTPSPVPASTDVDIAPCPKCRAELTVDVSDLGKDVECPYCQTVYTAARPQPKAGTQLARPSSRSSAAPAPPSKGDDGDSKKKPYEFKAKKKDDPFLDEEDDEGDRPRKKKKKRRPRKSYDDYEEEKYRSYSSHDGVAMLLMAIVSFFCGCIFLAAYVVFKSTSSISEIKAGSMDPSGRVLLEVARAVAIVSLLIDIAYIGLYLTGFAVGIGGGGGFDPDD
jgi:transcription elongation factor Elf1